MKTWMLAVLPLMVLACKSDDQTAAAEKAATCDFDRAILTGSTSASYPFPLYKCVPRHNLGVDYDYRFYSDGTAKRSGGAQGAHDYNCSRSGCNVYLSASGGGADFQMLDIVVDQYNYVSSFRDTELLDTVDCQFKTN